MEYQWIQEFLSSPQLPDIISYSLFIISMVAQHFIKKFVKRDNSRTSLSVDIRVNKLKALEDKMEANNAEHQKEREQWNKEREELKKEIKSVKKALKFCSGNTKELVKSGVSNEVAKMLSTSDDNKSIDSVNYESSKTEVEDK